MAPYKEQSTLGKIRERNIPFFFAFVFVFVATLVVLSAVGAVPMPQSTPVETVASGITGAIHGGTDDTSTSNTPSNTSGSASNTRTQPASNTTTPVQHYGEQPVRVEADTIGLNQKVVNPLKSDVATLDTALESGTVRYPGSAYLGETGNVLIFGHSSYLNVVYHQYYKEFNGIQRLKAGDTITVYSDTQAYVYSVTDVKLAKANDFVIDLGGSGKKLTLVTCNSFATKSDRFVVEADFVSSHAL